VRIEGVMPIGFANQGEMQPGPIEVRVARDGRVLALGQDLPPDDAEIVLDLDGAYISPGWIDLHVHVHRALSAGVSPYDIGPTTGVTCLVDAGSAGEASIRGLVEQVEEASEFRIKAFLNIGSMGKSSYNYRGIDLLATERCARQYRHCLVGLKVSASRAFLSEMRFYPVLAAKRLALDLGLPLMVHIGEPPPFLEELVQLLGPGDILTHCYHGKVGNSLRASPNRVVPLLREALQKGVLLDVGHGDSSFSVVSARIGVEEGILPDSISTDLHTNSMKHGNLSLALVMTKLLACGVALEDVVRMVTHGANRTVGLDGYGILRRFESANFTMFSVEEELVQLQDTGAPNDIESGQASENQALFHGHRVVRPLHAVVGSRLWDCSLTAA